MTRRHVIVDNDRWIRCGFCGHKLGKAMKNTDTNDCIIEIKCHSCKGMNCCHMNKNFAKEQEDD